MFEKIRHYMANSKIFFRTAEDGRELFYPWPWVSRQRSYYLCVSDKGKFETFLLIICFLFTLIAITGMLFHINNKIEIDHFINILSALTMFIAIAYTAFIKNFLRTKEMVVEAENTNISVYKVIPFFYFQIMAIILTSYKGTYSYIDLVWIFLNILFIFYFLRATKNLSIQK